MIGRRLQLPVLSKTTGEAREHFGWFTNFAAIDCPASSAKTRKQTGWEPTQPSLIVDINQPYYFAD